VPNGGMLDMSNDLSERPMYTEVSLKFSKGLNSAGDTSQSQYSRKEKILAEPQIIKSSELGMFYTAGDQKIPKGHPQRLERS